MRTEGHGRIVSRGAAAPNLATALAGIAGIAAVV
jgi:hypothetical protein